MSKQFINVPVTAETEQAKTAFITLMDSQKETISGFLNTLMSTEGQQTDAQLKVADGAITIYELAPDKGYVLGESQGEIPMQLTSYSSVSVGNRYVNQEKELTVLYIKKPEGVADAKLGMFKSINDAVIAFNSEPVLAKVKQEAEKTLALAKKAEKTERRLERLGMSEVESTPSAHE